MKKNNEPTVIQSLYKACEKEVKASESRSVRNKLSDRDIRRAKLEITSCLARRVKPRLSDLKDLINETKAGCQQISTSTLSRQLSANGIICTHKHGDYPANVDLPKWLAKRRGFCDKFKKRDKSLILMGDEAFFSLHEKQRLNEKTWSVSEHRPDIVYERRPIRTRVTVWGATGLNYCSPLIIFEHGMYLNGEEYAAMMDAKVLPALNAFNQDLTLLEDNCTIHNTPEAQDAFDGSNVIHEFLPARSADISWQEKVWANMATILYDGGNKQYSNKHELMEALQAAWKDLTSNDDYRRRLVVKGEAACKKIIDNQGFRIHWD